LNDNEVTVVRLRATAEKAGEFAKYESDVAEFRVRHVPKPPPVPPPGLRLTLTSPHEQPATVGGPLVVDVPTVAISATVRSAYPVEVIAAVLPPLPAQFILAAVNSANPIELIEWELDDGKGWVAGKLDGATMTDKATIKSLEPGKPRKVRVRTRHKGGEFATEAVDVVYHPRPPVTVFDKLPPSVRGSVLVVRGRYSQATAGVAFAAKVMVTGPGPGQSREFPATATPGPNPSSGTWQAAVTLFPGANKLGVVVSNTWRTGEAADRAELAYRRPPVVVAAEPVSVTAGGTGDVLVRLITADGLDPTGLLVNGGSVRTDPPRRLAAVFGLAWWELKAADVSVKTGEVIPESVAVVAVNSDGTSRPVNAVVRLLPPPPRPVTPPVIVLDLDRKGGPGVPIHTTRPGFAFGLRVTSGTRLTRVEVRYGPPLPSQSEQVRPVKVGVGGSEAEDRPEVSLREGVNRVRVVAANAGGEVVTEFTVSYTPPPVRVVIDHIDEIGPGRKALPLTVSPGGGPITTTGAFLEVRGRIIWIRDDDKIAADPSLEVVVSANRVVHLPERCAARVGTAQERAFKAPVYLNASDTAVRVEVRTAGKPLGLPQEGSVAELAFSCKNPLATQRLHVLVIGVAPPGVATHESDRQDLTKNVVAAVGGKIPGGQPGFVGGEFKHPAFASAILYRPRIGTVERSDIVGLIREVEREVRQAGLREGTGWVNDVVLVYYQGRDLIGTDGRRRLHTTVSLSPAAGEDEGAAILVEDLPATPGVRVVLLNVHSPGAPQPTADAVASAAGPALLRYPWQNPAAMAQLFGLFERAITERATFGGVIDQVRDRVGTMPAAAEPTDRVPQAVRDRRIGLGPP
jgi:hypothetical protein